MQRVGLIKNQRPRKNGGHLKSATHMHECSFYGIMNISYSPACGPFLDFEKDLLISYKLQGCWNLHFPQCNSSL